MLWDKKNKYLHIVIVTQRDFLKVTTAAITASTGGTTAAIAANNVSSSYRVKFRKREFLTLVEIAKPKIIYHTRRIHFFSYDGFVIYTFECENNDFKQRVIEAIEFSNQP